MATNERVLLIRPEDWDSAYASALSMNLTVANRLRPPPPKCAGCEKTQGPFSHCARCKKVHYCSKECQVADWKKGHRDVCKK